MSTDRRLLDALHRQPAVQAGAAPAGARRGHALLDARRPPGPRRRGRPVVRQRRPCRPRSCRPSSSRRRSWTSRRPSRWATRRPSNWPASSRALRRRLDKVFFTNSGSEAVDTALKIGLAYHRARGEGTRTRLIGRERGYHGVGFGGISVGGIVGNRKAFGTLLPGVDHSATRTTWRATPSRAASPSMAPNWPTTSSAWSRCTTPRPSPPSSSSPWPAPPACWCRPRATCSACARSATSTASC
jgi:hypothetical protein